MPLVINTFKPLRQKSKIFATSPKGEALGIMLSTLNSDLIFQQGAHCVLPVIGKYRRSGIYLFCNRLFQNPG